MLDIRSNSKHIHITMPQGFRNTAHVRSWKYNFVTAIHQKFLRYIQMSAWRMATKRCQNSLWIVKCFLNNTFDMIYFSLFFYSESTLFQFRKYKFIYLCKERKGNENRILKGVNNWKCHTFIICK